VLIGKDLEGEDNCLTKWKEKNGTNKRDNYWRLKKQMEDSLHQEQAMMYAR